MRTLRIIAQILMVKIVEMQHEIAREATVVHAHDNLEALPDEQRIAPHPRRSLYS